MKRLVLMRKVPPAPYRVLACAALGLAFLITSAQAELGFLGVAAGDATSTKAVLWTRAANTGIGLANTRARLQTIFGDRHSFELVSDHGLAVNVRLPISAPTQ